MDYTPRTLPPLYNEVRAVVANLQPHSAILLGSALRDADNGAAVTSYSVLVQPNRETATASQTLEAFRQLGGANGRVVQTYDNGFRHKIALPGGVAINLGFCQQPGMNDAHRMAASVPNGLSQIAADLLTGEIYCTRAYREDREDQRITQIHPGRDPGHLIARRLQRRYPNLAIYVEGRPEALFQAPGRTDMGPDGVVYIGKNEMGASFGLLRSGLQALGHRRAVMWGSSLYAPEKANDIDVLIHAKSGEHSLDLARTFAHAVNGSLKVVDRNDTRFYVHATGSKPIDLNIAHNERYVDATIKAAAGSVGLSRIAMDMNTGDVFAGTFHMHDRTHKVLTLCPLWTDDDFSHAMRVQGKCGYPIVSPDGKVLRPVVTPAPVPSHSQSSAVRP